MEASLMQIYQGVLEGDSKQVQEQVGGALEAAVEPAVILNQGMIAAMAEVGRLFEEGEYFVPEMLVAARAMQAGSGYLRKI